MGLDTAVTPSLTLRPSMPHRDLVSESANATVVGVSACDIAGIELLLILPH